MQTNEVAIDTDSRGKSELSFELAIQVVDRKLLSDIWAPSTAIIRRRRIRGVVRCQDTNKDKDKDPGPDTYVK